ncbi:uncharacterized protein LOC112960496 isoform X3 [Apteryx rowi]|uniref:uncharacterized protein LOC112960496 isoform X3 n=1 Tax=Apteryx rowi TaxID=308060 RepID=UPI000E1C999D|nr:uncharacterized protein LOC112960496 isoform X3 [Apteryx rowi]
MIAIALQLILIMCFGSLATCIPPLATGPNNLAVIQTPTKVHLSIGDSTEIACIWEKISSIERYRVSWYLVNEENITKTVTSELVYISNVTHKNKDVLVIEAANVNNTGFYYCEIIIEIPFCERVYGNGTTLTVEMKGSTQLPMPEERHEEEQMLQLDELHGRSEFINEAAEENSSCNSAEWAVSTLYESFDLFCNEPR